MSCVSLPHHYQFPLHLLPRERVWKAKEEKQKGGISISSAVGRVMIKREGRKETKQSKREKERKKKRRESVRRLSR